MHKATLTSDNDTYQHRIYYGITQTKFKQRYANHVKSSRHEINQSDTELSNELSYGALKTATTLQENTTHITVTPKGALVLEQKS